MPGFGGSFRRPMGGAGMGTDPIAGGAPSFNPASGAAGGGGIGTDPIGGGGAPGGFQPQIGGNVGGGRYGFSFGPFGNTQQPDRTALTRAEEMCARGDGSQCILAEQLRRQYEQATQQYNAKLGVAQMPAGAGSMGTGSRGRRGNDPGAMGAAMMGAMYGMPMGGGGGW